MSKHRSLEYLTLTALLLTFLGFFAVRVWDIDFWWHIAAGKNMLVNGAIPDADPFGAYDATGVWGQTILKSEWLGQVLLYQVYAWFGFDGIIYLRAGLLTLCLGIAYMRCRLRGAPDAIRLITIALVGLAILQHTGERPQLFSFLYLSLVFLLLDAFARFGKRWLLYCIPLVMLLWSNTHGGAVLGELTIGLHLAGTIIESRLAGRKVNTPEIRLILLVVGLSAIVLLLAPNGFTTLEHIISLESNPIRDRTSEYQSPVELWRAAIFYWVFVGAALMSLPGFINGHIWKQGVPVLVIGLISLSAYRYTPFFVLLAAPYVAAGLGRMFNVDRASGAVVNLSLLLIATGFLGYGLRQGRAFQNGVLESRFPVEVVDFIEANGLHGKIFNTMNWGGYLIWRLPATSTVYVDGRMLDPGRIVPYTHILWTTPEGKQFFDEEHFDIALLPYGNVFTQERYPLIDYLQHLPNWQLVYRDTKAFLFVHRAPVNSNP